MTPQEEYELGLAFYNGEGQEKNIGEAIKHFEIAANAGNLEAMNELGKVFYQGADTPYDFEKALYWFSLASEHGLIKATYNLGVLYSNDATGHKDAKKAFIYFEKAVQEGFEFAIPSLAYCYYNGEGVDSDYHKAFELYVKASDNGDKASSFWVSRMYYEGTGVKQDYAKVFHYLQLACGFNGEAEGQLGYMYSAGDGIEKNLKLAIHYYEVAISYGHAKAMWELGDIYYDEFQDYAKALYYYQMAVETKDPDVQGIWLRIGYLYEKGLGVPKDQQYAFECYEKAADAGEPSAYNNVGTAFLDKDPEKALAYFKKAIENGAPIAYLNIGYMYANGIGGLEKDLNIAFDYYQKAYDAGEGRGAYLIAIRYLKGDEVKQDFDKAYRYLMMAAEKGYLSAMIDIGYMYQCGQCVQQDPKKAFEWYCKAQSLPSAQFNIGWCYYYGYGVKQDYESAAKWLMKADKTNKNSKATYLLGKMFSVGKGVELNHQEAFRLFRKAAFLGHTGAQVAVGNAYCIGRGVSVDKNEAIFWWKKAARNGRYDSLYNLGCAYFLGDGVAVDKQEALKWFEKAAQIEDPAAQKQLGYQYYWGEGTSANIDTALSYFKLSASNGDEEAANCVKLIESGDVIPHVTPCTYILHDLPAESIESIKKRAESGDRNAQLIMANMCCRDERFVQYADEATEWYLRAAKQGDAEAQFKLACFLLGSDTFKRDGMDSPFDLISASAAGGYPKAKYVQTSIDNGSVPVTEEKLSELCNSAYQPEDIIFSFFGASYDWVCADSILFVLYLIHKGLSFHECIKPDYYSDCHDGILAELYNDYRVFARLDKSREKVQKMYDRLLKIDRQLFDSQYPACVLSVIRRIELYGGNPVTFPSNDILNSISDIINQYSCKSVLGINVGMGLATLNNGVSYTIKEVDCNSLLLCKVLFDANGISDCSFDSTGGIRIGAKMMDVDGIICMTPLRVSSKCEYDIDDYQCFYTSQIISRKLGAQVAVILFDYDFCISSVSSKKDLRESIVRVGCLKRVVELPKGTFGDVGTDTVLAILDFSTNNEYVEFCWGNNSLTVSRKELEEMDYSWNYRIYNQKVDLKDGQEVFALKDLLSDVNSNCDRVNQFVSLGKEDFSSSLLSSLGEHRKRIVPNTGTATFWEKYSGPGLFVIYDGGVKVRVVKDEDVYSAEENGVFIRIKDDIIDIDYFANLLLNDYSLSRYLSEVTDINGRFSISDLLNRKIAIYTDKRIQRQQVENVLTKERQGVLTKTKYSVVFVAPDAAGLVMQYSSLLNDYEISVFRCAEYVESAHNGDSYVSLQEQYLSRQTADYFDAIIIDAEVRNSEEDDDYGLGRILEDYSKYIEKGVSVYIYSDIPASRLGLRPGERKDLVDGGRFFNKHDNGYIGMLLEKVRDDLDKKNSPVTHIRSQYKDIFDAAEKIDQKYNLDISGKITDFILDGCKIDDNPAASACGPFRLAGHRLIEIMQSKNMVPKLDPGAIPHLLSDKYYYDKKDKKRYYQYYSPMPQYLSDALCYFFSATNAGVHGSQDSSLIGRSTLNILMEFILWFHQQFIVESNYDFNIPDRYFWGVKDDYGKVQKDKEYVVSCIDDGKEKYYYCENVHLAYKYGLKAGCKVRFVKDPGDDFKPRFDNGVRIIYLAKEDQYLVVPDQQ